MNLGIYISSLSNHDILSEIDYAIHNGIKSKKLSDASIFYDNISYQPFNFNCGLFNSTELWNFSGLLIATSFPTCLTALKIVNKIDIFYYYGLDGHIPPLSLIFLQKEGIKFIARSEKDSNDLFRKTGHLPLKINNTLDEFVKNIR